MSLDSLLHARTSDYTLHPLGLSYVDPEGQVTMAGSDHPEDHIREAYRMDGVVRDYLRSEEGQTFITYAKSHGKKPIQLQGAGAADLGDSVVAAVLHDGKNGIIVGNADKGKDFHARVNEFADQYGIDSTAALEYVLTHEFTHVAGYTSEKETEKFIKHYFLYRLATTEGAEKEKYGALAQIAEHREKEVQYRN